jgi:hypothetical protein
MIGRKKTDIQRETEARRSRGMKRETRKKERKDEGAAVWIVGINKPLC